MHKAAFAMVLYLYLSIVFRPARTKNNRQAVNVCGVRTFYSDGKKEIRLLTPGS
jgi:hypothetical protein